MYKSVGNLLFENSKIESGSTINIDKDKTKNVTLFRKA